MAEYKFPALEITVPYEAAADFSKLLQEYHPQIYSVLNSDSVFDIVSPESILGIPSIARFIIEDENPEKTETEIIKLANENNISVSTRILHNEDEMIDGNSLSI
ncbi:MAG: hypothetical protein EOP53_15245 [Sphingobacteriales bacterium]|nr:MAG: hypothetical protein EOP53_15245 [Sphingobacteriales bacterium]